VCIQNIYTELQICQGLQIYQDFYDLIIDLQDLQSMPTSKKGFIIRSAVD